MHNHNDKYPARPGFEPGPSRLQAPDDTNEPSIKFYLIDMAGPGHINKVKFDRLNWFYIIITAGIRRQVDCIQSDINHASHTVNL